MSVQDTIIAVSTARGYAQRAVVRLSGGQAVRAVARVFKRTGRPDRPWDRTFTVTPGTFDLPGEGLSVGALLYVMRAPHSYTREDVVEIHLPGSPALLDMVLDELLSRGSVRLAEPGEFTRRAFLNGRIDLAQAEAVLAIVRARSEAELLAAGAKLEGEASRECARIQDRVTELRALVEAALDFSEHDIEIIGPGELLEELNAMSAQLRKNLEGARGELASDGATHVAICGQPNAGKSTLFNRLCRQERAIVNPRPGTTRDPVRAELELHGVHFVITDTAGIRKGSQGLEAAAAGMASAQLQHSQLVLFVLDGSGRLSHDALEPAAALPSERVLWIINKCDLPQVLDEEAMRRRVPDAHILHTSALTGEGVEGLQEALGRVVCEGRLDASAADCLFNARQRDAVRRALSHVAEARAAVEEDMGYEFVALHLREINDDLAGITGRVTSSEVLDHIFSRFCIGK